MIAIDIPMPKSCEDCPFSEKIRSTFADYNSLYLCSVKGWMHHAQISQKPNWCPLQEVQKFRFKHLVGNDLIEKHILDEFEEEEKNRYFKYIIRNCFCDTFKDYLFETPGFLSIKDSDFPPIEKEISMEISIVIPNSSHSEQGS